MPEVKPARSVTFAEFEAAWERLAERARDFAPSVVVLVARKAPRMWQVLGLDFGDALVISDLAVPFAFEALNGGRVAVVDDVINVGSTISRAVRGAQAAGAAEVRAFAITHRQQAESAVDGLEIALDRTLDRERLREFGRLVPQALRGFDKPYDLDFPILRCEPAVPYSTFAQVVAALRDYYGEEDVYDVSTRDGSAAGVHSITVDLSGSFGLHRKVRIYFNPAGHCHVIPFDIPPILKTGPLSRRAGASALAVWEAVAAPGLPDHADARARLRMYCESLSVGEEFLARHGDVLHAPVGALDLDEALLVLGPRVRNVEVRDLVPQQRRDVPSSNEARPGFSPFLPVAKANGLIEAMRAKLRADWDEPDELAAFVSCIDVLGSWVGADAPGCYKLGWPYSLEEIAAEPYLRLHIGPTMPDLLEIVRMLLGRTEADRERTRREVTRLLDRLIDAGAVVPTTATYEGRIYRIYRKGEGSPRDIVSARIQNALYEYQLATKNDLVATLMTKVLTVMSFSEEEEANPGVRPVPEARGNVVSYEPALFDDGAEVFYYLLQTRLVERT